jgi:DNA primase
VAATALPSSTLEILAGSDESDVILLHECIEAARSSKPSSSAFLLGRYHGEPKQELLIELASKERHVVDDNALENELLDAISKLASRIKPDNIDDQVDKLKLKNYAQISESEKLEFMKELREIQRQKERGRD